MNIAPDLSVVIYDNNRTLRGAEATFENDGFSGEIMAVGKSYAAPDTDLRGNRHDDAEAQAAATAGAYGSRFRIL